MAGACIINWISMEICCRYLLGGFIIGYSIWWSGVVFSYDILGGDQMVGEIEVTWGTIFWWEDKQLLDMDAKFWSFLEELPQIIFRRCFREIYFFGEEFDLVGFWFYIFLKGIWFWFVVTFWFWIGPWLNGIWFGTWLNWSDLFQIQFGWIGLTYLKFGFGWMVFDFELG